MKTRSFFYWLALALMFCCTGCRKNEARSRDPRSALSPEQVLFARADSLKNALRFDSATPLYRQAQLIFFEKQDWEKFVTCRRGAAWCRWYDHDSEAAIDICNATLPLALERLGPNHLEIARLYIVLGNIHADRRTGGNMQQALDWFEKARRIFKVQYGDKDPALAEIYDRFAIAHYLADDHIRAIAYADSAVAMLDAPNTSNVLIWCRLYNNLGLNYEGLGRSDRALDCFQKARTIYLAVLHREDSQVVKFLKNIAHAQLGMGDPYSAQLSYEEALALENRVGEPDGKLLAFVREGLGDCQLAKGDTAAAIAVFDRCLHEFWPEGPPDNRHGRALLLYKIGQCQLALRQTASAMHSFQASAALADARQFEAGNFNRVKPLLGLGDALAQTGKPARAEACWQQALGIALHITGPRHPVVCDIQTRLARHCLQAGRLNEALSWATAAQNACLLPSVPPLDGTAPDFTDIGKPAEYIGLLNLLGQIHTAQYRLANTKTVEFDSALAAYRQAILLSDTLKITLFTDNARQELQKQVASISENALDCIDLKWQRTADETLLASAFWFVEKSKSALLAAGLRESEAGAASGLPPALREKELTLKTQCEQQHRMLASSGSTPADTAGITRIQTELNQSRHALDDLMAVLRRDYPDYFRLKYDGQVAALTDISAFAVARQTTVMEYFWGERAVYAFAISPNSIQWKRLGAPEPTRKLLSALRDDLEDFRVSPTSSDAASKTSFLSYCQNARILHEQLLAPLLAANDTTPLLIIPDGLLGFLPFQVLLTQAPSAVDSAGLNYRALPYLLRYRPVQYEFSATALLSSAREPGIPMGSYVGFAPEYASQPPTFALAGGPDEQQYRQEVLVDASRAGCAPLHFNQSEIARCAALMNGQSLTGDAANKQHFAQLAPQAGILHLAMHALTNNSDPSASSLVFSNTHQESGVDNQLYGYELVRMRLRARLAVLSACNTGVGAVQKGEGVMSLARAFRNAGCPAIVTSLWTVDDATAEDVVVRFFGNLQQGQDKSRALRGAALSFLAETKSDAATHPGYWASLVLVGDAAPLPCAKSSHFLLALSFIGACLLLGITGWATRRFFKK